MQPKTMRAQLLKVIPYAQDFTALSRVPNLLARRLLSINHQVLSWSSLLL